MYFISIGKLSDEEIREFIFNNPSRLCDTIEDSLVDYMKFQYDTFLNSNNEFIVTDEYKGIYKYMISIYKISPEYISLVNRYMNREDIQKPTPGDITSIEMDEVMILSNVLDKYGYKIKHIKSDGISLDNTINEAVRAQQFLFELIEEYKIDYIEMGIIPQNKEEVKSPIKYMCRPYIATVNLSNVQDEYEVRKLLTELEGYFYQYNMDNPNKSYSLTKEYTENGISNIYLNWTDIGEGKNYIKESYTLWNTLHETLKYEDLGMTLDIDDMYYSTMVEHLDVSKLIDKQKDSMILRETTKIYGSQYSPVYIVLTDTGSIFSKGIKKVTGSPYNHASISFDSNLDKMYSFSPNKDKGRVGFSIENMSKSYLEKFGDVKMQMYTVFVNQTQVIQINNYLDKLLASYKAKYNFVGLLGFMVNKPMGRENSKFCSEFVDEIFKLVDIDLTHKQSRLVEPYDFAKSKSSMIIKVYEGPMSKLNPKKIDSGMNKIFLSTHLESGVLNEAKKFPIQFDKDGNLVIKNMKKLDLQSEYEDSHRLLMLYDKNNNEDGLKYELSKIWFLNAILEKELYGKKKPSATRNKELINIRSRILNDFHKYMDSVSKLDRKFNFTEYYDKSPFSDAEIIINRETLGILSSAVRALL